MCGVEGGGGKHEPEQPEPEDGDKTPPDPAKQEASPPVKEEASQ